MVDTKLGINNKQTKVVHFITWQFNYFFPFIAIVVANTFWLFTFKKCYHSILKLNNL